MTVPHLTKGQIKDKQDLKKNAFEMLHQMQEAEKLVPPKRDHVSDRISEFETVEEEKQARREAIVDQVKVFRSQLPLLLKKLAHIPDPRNPKKTKHKLTVLIL